MPTLWGTEPGDPVQPAVLAGAGRADDLPLAGSTYVPAIWVEQKLTPLSPVGGALETLQASCPMWLMRQI